MHSSVTTIKAYGTALALTGIGFALTPNQVLPLFGLAPTQEIWVRLLGLTMGLLAIYYWSSALNNARHFYVTSVYARYYFVVSSVAVIFWTSAPLPALILSGISLVTALWTHAALRTESKT